MKIYYQTIGDVRGCCGHKHRTIASAENCRRKDSQGCKSQGGYSDRFVVAFENGERRALTLEENDESDSFYN